MGSMIEININCSISLNLSIGGKAETELAVSSHPFKSVYMSETKYSK